MTPSDKHPEQNTTERKESSIAAPCSGRAVALTIFQRPVGKTQSYVVTCECGWESKHTTDWRRSLDGHWYREEAKRRAA